VAKATGSCCVILMGAREVPRQMSMACTEVIESRAPERAAAAEEVALNHSVMVLPSAGGRTA